jgi:hypothetical protein
MAGTVDIDEKSLFPSGEQGNLVQESLAETILKIKSIAVGSDNLKETISHASSSPTPSLSPKGKPELRAI